MASPPNPLGVSPGGDGEGTDRFVVGTRFSPSTPDANALYAAVSGSLGGRNVAASPYSASFGIKDQMTLADIRRKAQEDKEHGRDAAHLKRYRHICYTSETSAVQMNERKLSTLYCSVCGAHALVTEEDFQSLPRRGSDDAVILESFNKLYTVPSDRVLLRRPAGLEVQYRVVCRDCGFPIGYRPVPFNEPTRMVYFFKDALVPEQSQAGALQRRQRVAPQAAR
ncbi:hypothetical protein BESB_052610 [Besnoitia besnoiti]|uniref:STEEP1 domain-containing protein n=1 Tax=Besnoitia besnoiti TaxID=94643 RepID=A0A2A9MJN2_BESBE|nr:hypothetical protein BESB_052610 [Besnoitia besnoiti]PFH35610.1 hypothetical protein BESB_052610 [Besnoitia besnoiti]